ncbi:MAG: ABC transporter permease [Acidobacteria bacterium]|nr:ABC transporter permease [Acidobacteriota bacterium]
MPLTLFRQLILRPLWGMGRAGDRARTLLSLLSVGLGVGVVLAIQLANRAAIDSFQDSIVEISGRANLSILATNGIDEELLPQLTALLGPEARISPVMESTAVVASSREAVPVLGLDVLQDLPFRDTAMAGAAPSPREFLLLLIDPNSLLVGESFAARYQLKPGSQIELLINDRAAEYTVRGMLAPTGPAKALAGNLVLMDIAAAQLAFGRLGRLDRMDLIVPPENLERLESTLPAQLPAGLRLERPAARAAQTNKMLRAFRWNLAALSYVSLVVGAFLIYNTIAVSVVRRRSEIGTLRALGATRGQVLALFLSEALLLGAGGGLIGIVLGSLLAGAALRLVVSTVNSLYLPAPAASLGLTATLAVGAIAIGMVTALVSALPPALEASSILPAEALQQGAHEYQRRLATRRYSWAAVLLLAVAGGAALLPPIAGLPLFGYLSVLLVIAGFSLLMPLLLAIFTRILDRPLLALVGIEGSLAARGLAASPARISILTMSLATAVAMMASVAIMVGSFRQTLQVWAEQTLRADLFLKPAAQISGSDTATMPPDAIRMVEDAPGVEAVDAYRAVEAIYKGNRVVLGSGDWAVLARHGNLLFLDGRAPKEVLAGDPAHNAIVSEPFATHYGVRRGDQIELDSPFGKLAFRVEGIYYDYTSDRGTIVLDRSVYREKFHDDRTTSLAVYLLPGANVDEVRSVLAERLGTAGWRILVTPNRVLQEAVLRVFDRTFAITYALEAVALLVAALGIANTLLAWVIERRRQLGILRVLGASRRQLRKMILTDSGLVGLLGLVTGGAMGWLLSLILIFTINKQSFGWTIQFHLPALFLTLAGLAIFFVTILAGLYPARVAARFHPAEVIAIE